MSTPSDRAEPLPAALGEVIGGYRLDQVLGAGGMGCVYAATHARLGRKAAVKVLRGSLAHDPVFVSRFFDEARVVNEIRHPNIIDIFDFVELDKPRRVACVMELIAGVTLREAIASPGLDALQATHVAIQLCDALSAVHSIGVVHRDLKPANILVCGSLQGDLSAVPSLKVLDFGIAKIKHLSDEHRTAAGLVLGTPAYMAPEQIAGEEVSAASDVYALGVVFYEMLAGERLFPGHSSAVMKRKFVGDLGPLELPAHVLVGEDVRKLLRAIVVPEPERRWPVPEVRARLVHIRDTIAVVYAPTVKRAKAASLPARVELPSFPYALDELPSARPRTGRVDVARIKEVTPPPAASVATVQTSPIAAADPLAPTARIPYPAPSALPAPPVSTVAPTGPTMVPTVVPAATGAVVTSSRAAASPTASTTAVPALGTTAPATSTAAARAPVPPTAAPPTTTTAPTEAVAMPGPEPEVTLDGAAAFATPLPARMDPQMAREVGRPDGRRGLVIAASAALVTIVALGGWVVVGRNEEKVVLPLVKAGAAVEGPARAVAAPSTDRASARAAGATPAGIEVAGTPPEQASEPTEVVAHPEPREAPTASPALDAPLSAEPAHPAAAVTARPAPAVDAPPPASPTAARASAASARPSPAPGRAPAVRERRPSDTTVRPRRDAKPSPATTTEPLAPDDMAPW